MSRVGEQGTVITNQCLTERYHYIDVKAPKIAAITQPGQFVFIRCNSSTAPFLRRPISICYVDTTRGVIGLLIKVVGEGTRIISSFKIGDEVDMMGPIGTPFPIIKDSNPLIVAGGIGIVPLMLLIEELDDKVKKPTLILGAMEKEQLFFLDRLKEIANTKITTEDGSLGLKGNVSLYLEEELKNGDYTHIYACGPISMLGMTQKIAFSNKVYGFVSLEERLACGIGACSGCAFPMKTSDGQKTYKKVCVDGPIFPLEEVIFNE